MKKIIFTTFISLNLLICSCASSISSSTTFTSIKPSSSETSTSSVSSTSNESSSSITTSSSSTTSTKQKIIISGPSEVNVTKTIQLEANVDEVNWESYDEEIATIDNNGLLKGICIGETTILCYKDGYLASEYDIEVTELTVPVIVFLGQSNGGYTYSSHLGSKSLKEYTSKISYWCSYSGEKTTPDNTSGSGVFKQVKCGRGGVDTARFGEEVGMSKYYQDEGYDDFYFIKVMKGATGFCVGDSSTWYRSWRVGAYLYNHAISFVKAGLEALNEVGINPFISTIFWVQGEMDLGSLGYSSYYNNTANFAAGVRNALNDYWLDDIEPAFVDLSIANEWTHKCLCGKNCHGAYPSETVQLNNAKRDFAATSSNNYFINVDEVADIHTHLESDSTCQHYDSSSMWDFGIECGKTTLNIYKQQILM